MTWKVKWSALDGTKEILCDERAKVVELYDEAVLKGFEPWVEDHLGKRIDRGEF